MNYERPNVQGFTLIELLVVIAIIGVLSAVILAALNSARDKALIAQAKSELKNVEVAMAILRSDTGLYPHNDPDICPPVDASGNEISLNIAASGLVGDPGWAGWNGPYIQDAVDPWGTPYYFDQDYQCTAGVDGCKGVVDPGTDTSVIVSCGPDRAIGGDGCVYNEDNIVLQFCKK